MATQDSTVRSRRKQKHGVYVIRCLKNQKVYVGSSVMLDERWVIHRRDLTNQKHHSRYLQRAWNKYGPDAFVFEVLEFVDDPKTLTTREQHHIDELGAAHRATGYNLCAKAYSTFGIKRTPEEKARISAFMKTRRASPETKAKMSAAQKGRKHSAETRAKCREINLGVCRPHTHETRDKMSKTRRGKPHSAEHSAAISAAKMGHTHSDECRAKIAATLRGTKLSPERIAKREATRLRNRLARETATANETFTDHASDSGTRFTLRSETTCENRIPRR